MTETELQTTVEEFKRALLDALNDSTPVRVHRTVVIDAGPLSVAIVVTRSEHMKHFETALLELQERGS